jgi:putative peptidoglycan lipid II flippase
MIFKNSLVLAFFSVISLFLAIVRDRLLATHVTVGPVLDVYNAAFRIPDLVYGAMLAFVTAGTVVPFLTKENSHSVILDPRQKLYSLTLFFGGVICIISVVVGLFLPLYAHYIVPGFTEDQIAQFIFATRLLLIQPFFLGVSSLISCFAQLRNEFTLYGIAPLGYSTAIIASIIFLYPVLGLSGLIYGVMIGSVLSLLIQAISLRNVKFGEIKYHFTYHHVRDLVWLAIPRTGTNITTQLRNIFLTGLATTFGPGSLSSYLFAQRITDAATQLVQQSITTASLPVLSKDYIEGRNLEYKKIVRKYVILLGFAGACIAAVINYFEDEIIWLLYDNTLYKESIIYYLHGFLLILPFTMMSGYLSISLYAMKDTKHVFMAFFISTLFSVAVGTYLRDYGRIALVGAFVTFALFQFLLLFVLYSRKKSTLQIV